MANGVLRLTIPKPAKSQPHKVEVKEEESTKKTAKVA
jgi:hypothetical protein